MDLEVPIDDGRLLPNQLVHPGLNNYAVPLLVHVNTVSATWRASVDEQLKSHRSARRLRPHYEMEIAGVKPVRYATI